MIRLVVYGRPAPQGSKRHVGKGVMVESSKYVKPWRQDVKAVAEAFIEGLPLYTKWGAADVRPGIRVNDLIVERLPLDCPLRVRMVFTVAKPASAPKRKTTYPDRMPDGSKLQRATEDALTDAGIWKDDARIVEWSGAKRYPNEGQDALDRPGCVITVEPMEAA